MSIHDLADHHLSRRAALAAGAAALFAPLVGRAEAVAVRGDRIVFIGALAEAQYNHAIQSREAAPFAKFLSPTLVELSSTGEVTSGECRGRQLCRR